MRPGGIPSFEPYASENAAALIAQLDRLMTFVDVEIWDRRAQEETARIRAYLDALSAAELRVDAAESRARESHAAKWFLARMLSSPKEVEAAACSWRNQAAGQRAGIGPIERPFGRGNGQDSQFAGRTKGNASSAEGREEGTGTSQA